jgi:hypothetical protein
MKKKRGVGLALPEESGVIGAVALRPNFGEGRGSRCLSTL